MDSNSMAYGTAAVVVATLLGPILAVQAQKWVERFRERQGRKIWVFQTLMATRAARLSADHVRALNMIDLAFYGRRRFGRQWQSRSERRAFQDWREYLNELTITWDDKVNNDARLQRRSDLFIDLLESIGADVGYTFDRLHLSKEVYYPAAHEQELAEQQALRRAAISVFSGEAPLKLDVERFPTNPEIVQSATKLYDRLNTALDGGVLSVKVESDDAGRP
jgi:Family of unknown function (DUF6680)